jgi:8-oxo-dGTP pyrophosphatase MutT (NUDIX family)
VDAFDESNVHAQAIREAMEESGIPLDEVWLRYFSFTGTAGEYEVDAYLNGSLELPEHERDLLAHAVNELINELPPRRMAPYSDNETNASAKRERSQEDSASEDRR